KAELLGVKIPGRRKTCGDEARKKRRRVNRKIVGRHASSPQALGGLRLWIASELPSGSAMIAIRQTPLSIGSIRNFTPAARSSAIAASKSATSSAIAGPSDEGFHCSPDMLEMASVPGPMSY